MKKVRVKRNITIDPDALAYVKRTGRTVSVSERINQLLARGINSEKIEKALRDSER